MNVTPRIPAIFAPHRAPISGLVPLAPHGTVMGPEGIRTISAEDIKLATSPSTKMALALARKSGHTYEGTVPHATVVRRRAANKRARAARRAQR